MENINFEDFNKIDLRVGEVLEYVIIIPQKKSFREQEFSIFYFSNFSKVVE